MTTLRWDNVSKPRVERPPLLVPSSKSARRTQKPPNLKNRIGEISGARIELEDRARSARAVHATSAEMESERCSACKARGVTLWQVAGRLVCASCRKAARKEGTVTTATAGKDITWAARQGAADRKAGTECRKYKAFLRINSLPTSQFTLRMWNAYLAASQPTKPVRINPPRPKRKQKSYWTSGLTLSDTTTPRRKTVRRYDRVEPRQSEMSSELAALLMQLNQQNTLVDMWR